MPESGNPTKNRTEALAKVSDMLDPIMHACWAAQDLMRDDPAWRVLGPLFRTIVRTIGEICEALERIKATEGRSGAPESTANVVTETSNHRKGVNVSFTPFGKM